MRKPSTTFKAAALGVGLAGAGMFAANVLTGTDGEQSTRLSIEQDARLEHTAPALGKVATGSNVVPPTSNSANTPADAKVSQDPAPNNMTPTTVDVLSAQEAQREAFEKFISTIANPKEGNSHRVVSGTLNLHIGAHITDERGTKTVLDKPMAGALNPAWSPDNSQVGFKTESGVIIVDINENTMGDSYMFDVSRPDPNTHLLVPANTKAAINPENAATAQTLNIDGPFGYGSIEGAPNAYIAALLVTDSVFPS